MINWYAHNLIFQTSMVLDINVEFFFYILYLEVELASL